MDHHPLSHPSATAALETDGPVPNTQLPLSQHDDDDMRLRIAGSEGDSEPAPAAAAAAASISLPAHAQAASPEPSRTRKTHQARHGGAASSSASSPSSSLSASDPSSFSSSSSSSLQTSTATVASEREREAILLREEEEEGEDTEEPPPPLPTLHAAAVADREKNCDRRRPEEVDHSRLPTMSTQLIGKTVTPYLKEHIPGLYAPVAKSESLERMRPNKDPDSKYCYRHRPDLKCRRAADETKMAVIQRHLEKLPAADQQAITHVWSIFSAAPSKHRELMLQGIITQCCFPQLSTVSREVHEQLKIDFVTALPPEISFKILCYLDTVSLCKAAQVSRQWRQLADDDLVWHRMCEQHIDRKCTKCGWGLPLLERKRLRDWTRQQQLAKSKTRQKLSLPSPDYSSPPAIPAPLSLRSPTPPTKRDYASISSPPSSEEDGGASSSKRQRLDRVGSSSSTTATTTTTTTIPTSTEPEQPAAAVVPRKFRPFKDVYRDRFRIGYNWRHGICAFKILRGHTNGVTCLQLLDNTLATGSYDATIKIWDIDTGEVVRTLRGHTRGVRTLQFDDSKLISGSLDGTIKIWNWHTGELLSSLACHTDGVISVHFDGELLASGSIDTSIKIFNFETKETFCLRGHADWVNSVRIDTESRTLLSASDDFKVKLWDLDTRLCVRTFDSHTGHVQQVLPLPPDFEPDEELLRSAETAAAAADETTEGGCSRRAPTPELADPSTSSSLRAAYGPSFVSEPSRPLPSRYFLSGGLDSTIRLMDSATGRCLKTFFGHFEGIWGLAGDTLRAVTAANDGMVKVWEPTSGKCERTFTGHRGPVTCISLSDSRMASGGEDGEVRLYSFQDGEGMSEFGTPS